MSNINSPASRQPREITVPAATRHEWADYFKVDSGEAGVRVSFGRMRGDPADPEVEIFQTVVLVGPTGPNFIETVANFRDQIAAAQSSQVPQAPAKH